MNLIMLDSFCRRYSLVDAYLDDNFNASVIVLSDLTNNLKPSDTTACENIIKTIK